jgi:zinc/manganese transport system substrate-binding protein
MQTLRSLIVPCAAALAVASAVVACGDDGAATSSGRPTVVATTPVVGDIVASTLGDAADVVVLMPRGADPHAFEPSARQLGELRDADLLVANGLGLESGLSDALVSAESDGVPVLELAPELDPIGFASEHDHDESEHDESEHDESEHDESDHDESEHEHGDLDPHVWFDPSRMAAAVPLIADAFVDAVPDADEGDVRAGADDYAAELLALDAEVEEILSGVPDDRRVLVTNHDTFGYFADRYGFEVLGVVLPGGDTLAAPSAAALESLAEEIEHHDVPVVFADEGVSSDLADALASEVGDAVEVVALFTDTLGDSGGPSGTYVDLVRTNTERIAEALG